MPGRRTRRNRLTTAQRLDYLFGSLHWFNDLIYLGFTVVLLGSGALLLTQGRVGIRPLLGAVVLLPSVLLGSGIIRALWSLRERTGIGRKRALLALANWLSLSWTVAFACLQGLFRKEGVFLRTPKSSDDPGIGSAIWAARSETAVAVSLWGVGVAVGVLGLATPLLLLLFAWQGSVYASSTFMSILNQRMQLPEDLERRRRTERRRERLARRFPYYASAALSFVAIGAVAGVILFGGANPGSPEDPFELPASAATNPGPVGSLFGGGGSSDESGVAPEPSPATEAPSPSTSVVPSPTASPSVEPSTATTTSVVPTISPSPS
jgi:hypothetical protein